MCGIFLGIDEDTVAGASKFEGSGIEVEYIDAVEFEGAGEAGDEQYVFGVVYGGVIVLGYGGIVGPFLGEFAGWDVAEEAYGKRKVVDGYADFR